MTCLPGMCRFGNVRRKNGQEREREIILGLFFFSGGRELWILIDWEEFFGRKTAVGIQNTPAIDKYSRCLRYVQCKHA